MSIDLNREVRLSAEDVAESKVRLAELFGDTWEDWSNEWVGVASVVLAAAAGRLKQAPSTGEVPVTDIHDGQDPEPIPDTTPKVGDILAFTREFEPFKAKDRVMVEAVEPDGTFQVAGVVRVVRRIDPQADGPVVEPVKTQEDQTNG